MKKSAVLWRKHRRSVFLPTPCRTPVMCRGRGCWVEDVDGKRYLDMASGQFSCLFGHGDRKLEKVVTCQLRALAHTNDLYLSDVVLEALTGLADILPKGVNKAILLSTGAEANECALRIAKTYTGRNGVIGFDKGYYGLTVATQSITAAGRYADPKVPNMFCIPVPDPGAVPARGTLVEHEDRCLAKTRAILGRVGPRIALFLLEPVLSAGGMVFPRAAYFRKLAALARAHGALLAFDEAQTGMGRTGTWFACDAFDVQPDILTVSKGAGCGLPVAAVVFSDAIARAIEGNYLHFSSHQNDPLAAAVLSYVIGRIKRERLLVRIRNSGKYLLRRLCELAEREPCITGVRGRGLMVGFELEKGMFSATEGYNPGFMLQDLMEEEGVLIQAVARGRIFRLLPPYTIKRSEIDLFVDKLAVCLKRLQDPICAARLTREFKRSPRKNFFRMFHPGELA